MTTEASEWKKTSTNTRARRSRSATT
jgi:hypothetical protein